MLLRRQTWLLCTALVISAGLSGCDKLDDLTGVERTMPDGVTYAGGARRAPLLNPVMGPDYNVHLANMPKDPTNPGPTLNPETGIYSAPNTGKGGRQIPAENLQAENAAAAVLPAPVGSNDAAAPTPAVTAGGSYPPLTTVPPVPDHTPKEQTTADFKAMSTDQGDSEAARRQLMTAPNATVMTSPQTGQMVSNPETAMPSPVTPQQAVVAAPTGEPESSPLPPPQPAKNASSDTGFNAWLHNLFAPSSSTPAANSGMVDGKPASANPPQGLMERQPANAPGPQPMAQTGYEPTMPPASPPAMDVAPEQAPPPAGRTQPMLPYPEPLPPAPPVAEVPLSPPVAAPQELEPVHLHPPGMAQDTSPVPAPAPAPTPAYTAALAPHYLDAGNMGTAPSDTVTLVPPSQSSGASGGASGHYLADSRYAQRRMSEPQDPDSSY